MSNKNKVMKRLGLGLFFLLCAFAVSAQSSIVGVVRDASKGSAIAYATISAEQGGKVAQAVAADASGAFELVIKQNGDYRIEISSVGYQSQVKEVTVAGKKINLGTISLKEGIAVDAVAVTVQKPIVTADAEKLSYSVEDDPEAQSSTLEEIIRKVPQLSIDAEGKVQMNGQSDYKILVNGRAAGAMGRNFNDIIKSMPASSIKKIEVITNPSMKYDAEGSGGVLNIITSKTRFDGYNGNIDIAGSSSFNRNYNGQFSGNFTVQKNKFSLAASLYLGGNENSNDPHGKMESVMENLTQDAPYKVLRNSGEYGWKGGHIYTNISMGYQIDTLNLITFEANYWAGKSRINQKSSVDYLDFSDRITSSYTSNQDNLFPWKGIDFLMAYEHTFADKKNHSLTISDYLSIVPSTPGFQIEDIAYSDGTLTNFRTDDINKGVENVFQADYNNKWGKHSFEAGVKHQFDHSNLYQKSGEYGGTTVLDKHIAALYAGYAFKMKKFSTRAGARLEGAWYNNATTQNNEKQSYSSALVNVVPYLSLSYVPSPEHNLSLSYTERLSRPGVSTLSPYATKTATTLRYGNPNLKTGVSHTLQLKYAWMNNKWMVSSTLMTMLSNNRVAQYTFVDKEGLLNTTYLNHGRYRLYALSADLSYRPSHKLQLSANARICYAEDGIPAENIEVHGWGFHQGVNATIALWKGARLTLSEMVMKFQPQQPFIFKNWFISTSARVGQKLLKDKMEISVSLQNPHSKENKFKQYTKTPTYILNTTDLFYARSIRLAVSYRFGKQGLYVKQTRRKRDSTTEEISGGNNQQQAMGGGGM